MIAVEHTDSNAVLLGRIDGTLTNVQKQIELSREDFKDLVRTQDERFGRIEARISGLEIDRSYVKGWLAAAAAAGGFIGAGATWLMNLGSHK